MALTTADGSDKLALIVDQILLAHEALQFWIGSDLEAPKPVVDALEALDTALEIARSKE